MTTWRVLQLADSAFPTGGFAHSGGLEAALHAGLVRGAGGLEQLATETLLAAAHAALPFVGAAWDAGEPTELAKVDAFAAATSWSHVATRASRAQGRALVDVAARAFGGAALIALRGQVVTEATPGHLAPMFGAVTRCLAVARDDAGAVYLHLVTRSLLSAAVRLGAVGPTEAQAIHARLEPAFVEALQRFRTLALADVAQTSPLVELVQAGHDRMYTRLFQT